MRKILRHKKGMTLAELMVSLTLLGILGTLCLAALSTYTENYLHINSLNRAHDVSDVLFKSIQKQVNNADNIVWADPSAGVAGTQDGGSELYFQLGGYPAYIKQESEASPMSLGSGGSGEPWLSIQYDNDKYLADGGEEISDRELAPSVDASFGFAVEELKFEKVAASNGYDKQDYLVKVTMVLENEKGIVYTASQIMECLGNARGLYGNAGEIGIPEPQIVVEKRLDKAGGSLYLGGMLKTGQELVYEITVRNNGSAVAQVQMEELSGFLLNTTAPFTLAAGEEKVLSATHTVGAGETEVTNIVTAHVKDEEGTALGDVAAVCGPVQVENTDFTVSKKITAVNGKKVTETPKLVNNGDSVTYEIVIKNNGNKNLKSLRMEDLLTVAGKKVSWEGAKNYTLDLKAKEEKITTVTYKVGAADSGELKNVIKVYLKEDPSKVQSAVVTTQVESGLKMKVTKKLHDYVITKKDGSVLRKTYEENKEIEQKPGESLQLNYEITVANKGTAALENLQIKDSLQVDEKGSVVLATSAAAGEGIPAGETRTYAASYTVKSTDPLPKKITNTAEVTADGLPASEKAVCEVRLKDMESLQLKKAILEDGTLKETLEDVKIGTDVVFQITLTNQGNTDLGIRELSERLDIAGKYLTGADVPKFVTTADGKEFQSTPFSIPRGTEKTLYVIYTVTNQAGGKTVGNMVQAVTGGSQTIPSNSVSFTVKVLPPIVEEVTWPTDADFDAQDTESGGGSACYFNQGNIVSYMKDGVKCYYIGAYKYLTGNRINKGDAPEDFPDYCYVRIVQNLGDILPGQTVSLQRGDLFSYKGENYVYTSKSNPTFYNAGATSGVVPQDWNLTADDNGGMSQYAVKVDKLTKQNWTK